MKHNSIDTGRFKAMLAVREGFEPSKPCDLHTFQACSFGHSDTSPYSVFCTLYSDTKTAATLA